MPIVGSLPLSEDHWLYEQDIFTPGGLKGLSEDERERLKAYIVDAVKYGLQVVTHSGTDMNFDPDALVQNVVVGLVGLNPLPQARES